MALGTTITPWNYPLALTMDVVPALLAGNAVVHKPDTQTTLSSLWPRSLAIEAGLPPDLWQVVLGDPQTIGESLITEADFIGFTGSTGARRPSGLVLRASASCSCPPNASTSLVRLRGVRPSFRGAPGCHKARVLARLRLRHRFAHLTATTGSGTPTRRHRVGRRGPRGRRGASSPRPRALLLRAHHPDRRSSDRPVWREETFGPVVAVAPFASDEEAIARANYIEYGLNASVFTKDTAHGEAVARQIRAGTVNVNEGHAAAYASQAAPMGGRGQSGLGRRHGPGGLLAYTEQQTVATQRVLGFDPSFGLSGQQHARLLTGAMKALKRLRVR